MSKQNKINNENEIINSINSEDEQIIEKVDEYNINQLLMNLFKRLLIKCETKQDSNNDNDSLLKILIEKIKSNYPNFYFSLKEPNENFGLFYTSMDKLVQEYSTSSNFTETDGFSLLGFFEEEIRNFFSYHPFLLKNAFKSNEKEKNNYNIENKIKEITNIVNENTSLINDISNEFKTVHTTEKQKYIDYINQQHAKINNAVENIKKYSYNNMSSEQNIKSLNKFKENLLRERKEKEEEIKYYETLINKYTSQGDEMTQLLNEYKKYSNMIDCLKNK
jgi:uncharacterized protein YoaH (UPF0181 family)